MKMKTALLGAAAGLMTVGAAQAADLPMTKAEAVEYVKVCSEFGEGFFYIPGTDTCLRIGGEIRADYRFGAFGTGVTRATDKVDFSTEGRLKFDARTATEYGTLRSYFQVNMRANNGAVGLVVDKAFIEFGGLTAGFAHSFFGFYDNDYGDTIFAGYFSSQSTVNLLAYTAAFGGGFTATVSLEDSIEHRSGLVNDTPGVAPPVPSQDNVAYGGASMPDIVGRLRVEQGWGSAALSGAVHQIRYPNGKDGSDYGWALGGTVAVKFPFLSSAWAVLEGTYADGAGNYLGGGMREAEFSDTVGTGTDKHKGWSLTGEIGVNVTPEVTLVGFGSYLDVTNTLDSDNDGVGIPTEDKFKSYILGANATYTVVKGLTIGGEVSYQHTSFDVFGDSSSWQGGVRIKRVF